MDAAILRQQQQLQQEQLQIQQQQLQQQQSVIQQQQQQAETQQRTAAATAASADHGGDILAEICLNKLSPVFLLSQIIVRCLVQGFECVEILVLGFIAMGMQCPFDSKGFFKSYVTRFFYRIFDSKCNISR